MKNIKSIAGIVVLSAFLAFIAMPSTSDAKTKPTGRTEHVSMQVSGMMCSECSKSLESCLGKLKGAENVKADYNTGSASLDVPASSQVTREQLKKAVADAGFTLKEVKFIVNATTTPYLKLQSQ